MPVPVHVLASTEAYGSVLAGHRQVFAPGDHFSYNNSGFVVLALIAERVSGIPFQDLVRERVCQARRHALTRLSCARTSRPVVQPSGISTIADSRTNVLHLPVLGSGDGGIYSTAADVRRIVGGADVGLDRVRRPCRRDDATAQPRSAELDALWLGLMDSPHERCPCARGVRRRRFFSDTSRPSGAVHLRGLVEHHHRRVAGRPTHRRTTRQLRRLGAC